jgi:hypothetical protein
MGQCQDGDIVFSRDGTVIQYQGNDFQNCDYTAENASFVSTAYYYGVCSSGWFLQVGDRRETQGSGSMVQNGISKLFSSQQLQDIQSIMSSGNPSSKRSGSSGGSVMWVPDKYSYRVPHQPTFTDKSIPSYEEASEQAPCEGVDICRLPNGQLALLWKTHFNYKEPTCPIDSNNTTSVMYPKLNLNAGNCYNYKHVSYLSVSCTDEHTETMAYYTNPDCTASPTLVTNQRSVCGTGDVSATTHCYASPGIFTPYEAPSQEPVPYADATLSASFSSLTIIIISVALLFFF